MSTHLSDHEVREAVRERYAAAASLSLSGAATSCCGPASDADAADSGGCCGSTPASDPMTTGNYDEDTPFDAAVAASLGCGNPTALAELAPGEDVLDLGSGGGLDVLLSARRIAPGGTAYGLDMTPEMLELAERHRAEAGIENATFMHGSIEDVPLPDESVDVVISNCVINLSPDKDAVLRESFRVLRPRGRFAVSDIVLTREIDESLRGVVALWTGCISGALLDGDYLMRLEAAGFEEPSVEATRLYDRNDLEAMAEQVDSSQLPAGMSRNEAIDALENSFASAFIRATKP
ncbi:MAG: arsenite methyltransferase [Dermatophilaceae bacterium]|nr:arsenite methyltransferase [Intrasporangiaceae bacterium]